MLSYLYSALETGVWKVVIDPSVNPVLPRMYKYQNTSYGGISYIDGPPYSGALASLTLITPPNITNARLSFELQLDSASISLANVFEFDIIVSLAKNWYNGSMQFNQLKDGMIQIPNINGSWIDTGNKYLFNKPDSPYDITTEISFDTNKKTVSHKYVQVDALTPFLTPANLQNIPVKQMPWADGVTIQVQMGMGTTDGTFSHKINEMSLTLW